MVNNRYTIARNPRVRRSGPSQPRARRLVIGLTDGGRALTLVVERTDDPTTWLIITGWEVTQAERRIMSR